MLLRSLRLKNIKSYGEGPAGEGITVRFAPGVNRVAGANGYGKTTLIEALGYALFFSEPEFEERFALPTYFLRSGEKEGEIEVVFEQGGQEFRVEKGVGQSRRKSKVFQLSDGSTCAEGDEAVSAFLCRLFSSGQHVFHEQKKLSDLFANLIGVKQGRLAWPFDSKPAAAKEFFEPLLDVAIFRESATQLNEAMGRFKELLEDQNQKLAASRARLQGLADSVDKVPLRQAELEAVKKGVERSRKEKAEAELVKQGCEQKLNRFNTARSALETARHGFGLASQRRETDQLRANESQQAAQIATQTEPSAQAFSRAEERLRILQQQQREKAALLRERTEALNARTQWEEKRDAAQRQARDHAARGDEQTRQQQTLRRQLADGKQALLGSRESFEGYSRTTAVAKRSRETLDVWAGNLGQAVGENQQRLGAIRNGWEKIQRWDAAASDRIRTEAQRLEQAAVELGRRLTAAEEVKRTLVLQLEQIGSGVCPFLKEKCRQFDPKAIQSDLGRQEKEIRALSDEHRRATTTYAEARKACETLAKQESEIEQLKLSIQDQVRRFTESHQGLFPAQVQKLFAQVSEYLTNAPKAAASAVGKSGVSLPDMLAPMPEASADLCVFGAETGLDTQRLGLLADSERDFLEAATRQVEQFASRLAEQFGQFDKDHADRVRQERDLEHGAQQLAIVEAELKASAAKREQLMTELSHAEAQAGRATARLAELEEKLKAYALLEQELAELQAVKDRTVEDHKAWLGARPLAGQLAERQKAVKKSAELEAQAKEVVRQRTEEFDQANRSHDPAALEKARDAAAAAGAKLANEEKDFREAETRLQEERERLNRWKQAGLERDKIESEIRRLKAAGDLAKMAGKVLKDAAPAVAQHLCSRIAANAQRIFNQIVAEPIELEWKAEPQYGLRVVPGERRFAMLSGGEQTKLALAMTLAMIQEFSGLRFAVFDEPTYAVDADSRQKLADAILEAQRASNLEQLVIVSHDDAFEGKIEHVVLLSKTAGIGTQLVAD